MGLLRPVFVRPFWAAAGGLWLGLACAQQIPLRQYTQADGLANQAVTALAQDADGYLWIGTENGLFRFDGARFARYGGAEGLPRPFVTAMQADRAGRIWVGTRDGLCYMERGRCLAVPGPDGKPMSLWAGQRIAAYGRDGVLAVSERALLVVEPVQGAGWSSRYLFSAAQRQAQAPLADIQSIASGADDELWMGCQSRVCRYRNGGQARVYGPAQGVPEGRWGGILPGGDGQVWLRSQRHLLSVGPDGEVKAHRPPGVDQGILRQYYPMLQDRDGALLATSDYGLLQGGAWAWRQLGAREGLKADGSVSAMLLDREGELWLAVSGRGLLHWQGYGEWENWTVNQGLPSDDVWSFYRTREGSLLLGTSEGLATLRSGGAAFTADGADHDGARHQRSAMVQDGAGHLWSGTFTGALIRRDHATGRSLKVASLPLIYRLLLDTSGQLWICTNTGLYVVREPGVAQQPRLVTGLQAVAGAERPEVTGACQSRDGTLWFAGPAGLLRHAGGRWSRPRLPLARTEPNLLSCDGDTLWLGSTHDGGVWRARADSGAAQLALEPLPLAGTPLAGLSLQSMHADRRHWLWFGTDQGVVVWNGSDWRLLNQQSGLVWNDTNQYALYEDGDGSIWIGTSGGASHLRRPAGLFAAPAMALRLDALRYGEQPMDPEAVSAVPWNGGALSASLAVTSFRNHEALRYRYRLQGLETGWTASENGVLHYPALPAGRYLLQAVADNLALRTSTRMLELALEVRPPWWRTNWFYTACALLALCLALAAHRWRLRTVMHQKLRMEALVRERTAELEASREEHRLRSLKDGLTQAWNRIAIMELAAQQIAASERGGSFLLVLLDLDHFKRVNDTKGHLAGDAVLREFVRRLMGRLRGGDAVGRYGGEEFILLLPGLDCTTGAARIDQLHRDICAEPVTLDDGTQLAISCSLGVAAGPSPGCTPESLLAAADAALYRAKENGRNRIEYSAAC
ncbi:diguanylate cyclase [Oxalobacteraceae bacterium A2-2]